MPIFGSHNLSSNPDVEGVVSGSNGTVFFNYLETCGYNVTTFKVLIKNTWLSQTLQVTVLIVLLVGGFVGNALLATAFIRHRWFLQRTYFIVTNILIVDALLTLIQVPMEIIHNIAGEPLFGSIGCKVIGAGFALAFYATPPLMMCLATERYIAITRVFEHATLLSWKHLITALSLVYIHISYMVACAVIFSDRHVSGVCNIKTMPPFLNDYQEPINFFVVYLIPGIYLSTIYFKIYRYIHAQRILRGLPLEKKKKPRKTQGEDLAIKMDDFTVKDIGLDETLTLNQNLPDQSLTAKAIVTATMQSSLLNHDTASVVCQGAIKAMKARDKMVKIFIWSVAIFLITATPYTVIVCTWQWLDFHLQACLFDYNSTLAVFLLDNSYTILLSNLAVNPFIFLCHSSSLRKAVRKIILCQPKEKTNYRLRRGQQK